MSSAHGAGLMLLPFITAHAVSTPGSMSMPMGAPVHGSHAIGWLMVAVHTSGYLLTMTGVALLVYQRLGSEFFAHRVAQLGSRLGHRVDSDRSVALVT